MSEPARLKDVGPSVLSGGFFGLLRGQTVADERTMMRMFDGSFGDLRAFLLTRWGFFLTHLHQVTDFAGNAVLR